MSAAGAALQAPGIVKLCEPEQSLGVYLKANYSISLRARVDAVLTHKAAPEKKFDFFPVIYVKCNQMEGKQTREQAERVDHELSSLWSAGASVPVGKEQGQEGSWVSASQRGDTLAFNRLVLKWERTVYNVALRMLQDREEAAEATQEVFLSAYKNIRRFRQDSKFSTWLYRIAFNHCVSRARRRPQGTHISLDIEDSSAAPPRQLRIAEHQEGELLQAENRNRIHTALSFLPPDQRAVIELKFFQEQTFEDISAILDVPLSTVKSRLYAGMDLLKVRLSARV
jgi:RNA polymerase sigma-70 factor (ECF subfamily)